MENDRQVCTADSTWSKDKAGRWIHPDAIEIAKDYGRGGGVADGDFEQYECPHCGKKFWVELPN